MGLFIYGTKFVLQDRHVVSSKSIKLCLTLIDEIEKYWEIRKF